jgi:LmbE family N-acetylglucosaminyl deacetylase
MPEEWPAMVTAAATANPYQAFVAAIAQGLADAAALPKGGLAPLPQPPLAPDAPVALVLAPHPDDECITGALPLRLRRAGYRVIDVAVTLGSNRARRAGRLAELQGACAYLGFELALPAPEGLERVTAATRASDPGHWKSAVAALAAVIARAHPAVVFLPHDADWNGTHIGTHFLGVDALAATGEPSNPLVVETEFWGAMTDPNLMVESSVEDVAALAAATAFHVGEVERNPYHLRLPAWMQDNVRRGGELVGGQGSQVPKFAFATLYRLGRFRGGQIEPPPSGTAHWLAADSDPRALLR